MPTPNLLIWNRIEPHPRMEDLQQSLQVQIRDPLWMLSRQWQMGEFQAEDAGMAAHVRLDYKQFVPNQIRDTASKPNPYDLVQTPLEAVIEKTAYPLDLFARIEIGRQWFRLLERRFTEDEYSKIETAVQEHPALLFRLPEQAEPGQRIQNADLLANEAYIDILATLEKEKMVDGSQLIAAVTASATPFSTSLLGTEHPSLDELGKELIEWIEGVYGLAINKNPHWSTPHLEHQFALEVPTGKDTVKKLGAEEYWGKRLDWFQFDSAEENATPIDAGPEAASFTRSFPYPASVKYKGMPSARWWELEDSAVNLGNIKANTASPANLMFSQFGLLYSNDWLTIPFEVELGSLNEVTDLVVTDNFGIPTRIKHLQETSPHKNWGLFYLHDQVSGTSEQHGNCLWMPPVIDDLQTGQPLEQLVFIRDEMANLVWAVEQVVPDLLGEGTSGSEFTESVREFLNAVTPPSDFVEQSNDAKVHYKLASPVPDHWIPFLPVRIAGQQPTGRKIQLQRAAMPRIIQGFSPIRIRPRTSLLSEGLHTEDRQPMYIFPEEVPRAGAILKGYWKRVRWLNGKTVVWYAREKTVGRGAGSSGLQFDFLEDKQ